MKKFILFTPFLAIIVILIFLQHRLVASLSPIQQKVALFQFKQSLNIITPTDWSYFDCEFYGIPSYPKTKNWSMSSDHCTWEGVSCQHQTGDVIGLDLSCSQLEGAILPNSTLFQLSHLRFLNLSHNHFSLSNQFPQEFGFFAKGLTHLNLSYTRFSGRVPSGISHLYKIVSIDLSGNYDVKLDDEVFKSLLQNLTQLRVLNLFYVNISSVLPVNLSTSLRVLDLRDTGIHGVLPQEVFHLPNIEALALGGVETDLQAVLPKVKWGSSGSLQHLLLYEIYIYGGIPDSIGFLESLVSLKLMYCNLSGPIPRSIGNVGQLTGIHGVLPQEVFHLPNIEVIALGSNPLQVVLPKVKWGSSGSLQQLDLSGIDIYGGIPDSIGFLEPLATLDLSNCNLSGPIPRSIGNLGQLTYLNLGFNNLNGPIPRSIGNLVQLTDLGLVGNNLNGSIPRSIGNLGQLTYLDLGLNNLNGQIPTVLTNLTKLKSLELSINNFNGPIPKLLPNLTDLRNLFLSYNNFTGPFLSSVAHFKGLIKLELGNSGFTGLLPTGLFNLPSLEELYLSDNGFTGQLYDFNSTNSQLIEIYLDNNLLNGPIPQSFSQLVNLTDLDLSSNNFNGVLDMKVFSRLESLKRLHLSHNSLLSVISSNTTTIPPNLEGLDLSSCNMKEFPYFSRDAEILLNWVDLSNNEIEGEIPHWIGSVGEYLNVSHNRLIGGLERLPWNHIKYLDLQSNKLNGSLPTLICNSSSLQILNLSNNTLSGVLPICRTELSSLSVLDLRMNNIQGIIPATMSNFQNLETINLNGNRLEGTIPSSFAEYDSLKVLDLGNNHIKDTFPQCLEALPNLQVLVLKSNKFHGFINKSSKVEHPFSSLRIIDLSYNDFSGPLPAIYFRNFKDMMNDEVNKIKRSYMERDYYIDSTNLVIKGNEILLNKILTVYTTIDVSKNYFEGKIPVDIGYLVSLRFLNLSHNHLRGQIPPSIGKLIVLESLDLSTNQLEGEIPQQLTGLYSLALLNLSCNQLRGHIPEGSQFDTFGNDSYVGNLGLCGNPLSKKCGHYNVMQEEGEDEDNGYFFSGFTWEAVVIGYGCGVVPAFIIGNLMLLAGKPKWFAGIIARELGLKIRRMEIRMR